MAAGDPIQIQHFVANNVTATPVSFAQSVQEVYVTASGGDVFVDFNNRTATTNSFRIFGGTSPNRLVVSGGQISNMSILGSAGAVDVYIMAVIR